MQNTTRCSNITIVCITVGTPRIFRQIRLYGQQRRNENGVIFPTRSRPIRRRGTRTFCNDRRRRIDKRLSDKSDLPGEIVFFAVSVQFKCVRS